MNKTIPATMRAAVLRDYQTGLHIEEIPTPHPKSEEVLIKVSACGLCHSDLHVLGGAITFPLPCILGHEVTGTIVEIGPHTEGLSLQVGQAVACAFLMPCGRCPACSAGRDDLCELFFSMNRLKGTLYDGTSRLQDIDGTPIHMYSMGGLSEYCVAPATSVTPLPEDFDPVRGAIIGCAALTAYGAVRRGADLRCGESVAVVATGGVGSSIIQLSAAFGAKEIIAIDISDEKLAKAQELGATTIINSATTDPRKAVLAATSNQGVDIAFEALGRTETWRTALDVIRDGGRMVPIGLGAGTQNAQVEINRLVRRSQRIIGSYGALTRQDLPEVVRLAASGALHYREIVSEEFALTEVATGYERLKKGQINGRAVVNMTK